MTDHEMDILTLVDEDGIEHEFEVAGVMKQDGKQYMALIPVFDGSDESLEEDGELLVLQVTNENGEEFLEAIQNEAEFNKISELFMNSLKEDYDFIS